MDRGDQADRQRGAATPHSLRCRRDQRLPRHRPAGTKSWSSDACCSLGPAATGVWSPRSPGRTTQDHDRRPPVALFALTAPGGRVPARRARPLHDRGPLAPVLAGRSARGRRPLACPRCPHGSRLGRGVAGHIGCSLSTRTQWDDIRNGGVTPAVRPTGSRARPRPRRRVRPLPATRPLNVANEIGGSRVRCRSHMATALATRERIERDGRTELTAGYESHSEAEMALSVHLAFWAGGDTQRMDRLFRRSGLLGETRVPATQATRGATASHPPSESMPPLWATAGVVPQARRVDAHRETWPHADQPVCRYN